MNINKKSLVILAIGLVLGIFIFGFFNFYFITPVSILSIFSPNSEDQIISLIDSSQKTIDIEMYTFSSQKIILALKRAESRGVKIRVILEKRIESKNNQKTFDELSSYGIAAKWASKIYELTHSKFMLIDGKTLLVGSINFSNNALNTNREAGVIIQNQNVIEDFKNVFEQDWVLASN
ncbi:MAG: phospholipase D-like domain-containing protein [Candidatus Micrarchaeota archaeon]